MTLAKASLAKASPAGRGWFRSASVYQIYPRSFKDSNGDGIGDLGGIIEKLDWIADLGVDAIWLCPIYASPQADNGYDISDYRAIHPEFGTMDDFDELLAGAHRRGLRLIMDMVLNHSSDEHPWFAESRSSRDSPKRGWYHWRSGADGAPPNKWRSAFGGPAWELDAATGEYYLHLFHKKQPDLNWENPDLRGELHATMRWWLDKGIDGFRLDVINLISKAPGYPEGEPIPGSAFTDGIASCANGPRIHEFLREMRREVFDPYGAMSVGESPCVDTALARAYTAEGRRELDMVFQFEMMDVDFGPLGKWDTRPFTYDALVGLMEKWQMDLLSEGWNSLFWNNHDQPRLVSRFGDPGAFRELSGKALAAFLYLQRGTAFIYQGEELGMTNTPFCGALDLRDVESLNYLKEGEGLGPREAEARLRAVRAKGRDNARTPVCWDSSPWAGFSDREPWIMVHPDYRSVNAEAALANSDSLLHFYRRLLKLRRAEPLVASGSIEFSKAPGSPLFLYRRYDPAAEGRSLAVGVVFGGQNASAPPGLVDQSGDPVLCNYDQVVSPREWRPWELRIWYEDGTQSKAQETN